MAEQSNTQDGATDRGADHFLDGKEDCQQAGEGPAKVRRKRRVVTGGIGPIKAKDVKL